MKAPQHSSGELLRQWRRHRRLSQFALALDAGVSQRHLSFIESGRSTTSRAMILALAERLTVPLREQNNILLAAGLAPVYGERRFDDSSFEAARQVVQLILAGHEPYPALAVDRHWTLLAANRPVTLLLGGVDEALLQEPVNVLRLSLHPQGLAPRVMNYLQWRAHILKRLWQQLEATADPATAELVEELEAYPPPPDARSAATTSQGDFADLAVPLKLATEAGILSFISTTTVFGTPTDITLSELAIESFFPTDTATATAMRRFAEQFET